MSFNFESGPYKDLRAIVAEQTRPLVVWVGAGLSVPAGMPSWLGLRRSLEEELGYKLAEEAAGSDEFARLMGFQNELRRELNPWDAFRILSKALGKTTYANTIRRSFARADACDIPEAYFEVWKLPLRGLINLNLDKIASRAFAATNPGKLPLEFSATKTGDFGHVLSSVNQTYILNAHGTHDDQSSWVLDRDELRRISSRHDYRQFLSSVLTTTTVLFLGISVDDRAVGGHLEHLKSIGMRIHSHYWITNQHGADVSKWAEDTNVQMIRYSAPNNDHSEFLEILRDLNSFVSQDEPVPAQPIIPKVTIDTTDLPSPEELESQEPEMIRLYLNKHAQDLLAPQTESSFQQYLEFTKRYTRSIHYAWWVDDESDDNIVLGYTLNHEGAKSGAFGTVYQAHNSNGEPVAIKILREEIRKSADALASFRRGVASMRILKQREIKGIVEYHEAAEIPALVVMEWVDGADLRRAVESGQFNSWADILRCSSELADILRNAHSVPERVLHRDVRPPNIMLDGFDRKKDWNVKVLDFDLSWHKGSTDRTLVHTPGATGYLAPEQIQRLQGISTRHAAVDSFGFGMTLFFMASSRDPYLGEHLHGDWGRTILQACRKRQSDWECLSRRFARLIESATRHEQHRRLDMTSLQSELSRLYDLEAGRTPEINLDLVAEEVALRSELMNGHGWDVDNDTARLEIDQLMFAEIGANWDRKTIRFVLRRKAYAFKNVGRRTSTAVEIARKLFVDAGWQVDRHDTESLEMNIVANWRPKVDVKAISAAASVIDRVSEAVRA